MSGAANSLNVFAACVLCLTAAAAAESVRLDFFMSPGCESCERIKKVILPLVTDKCELVEHDMASPESVPLLLAYQTKCGIESSESLALVIDRAVYLSGARAITTGLVDCVNAALAEHKRPGWKIPPVPVRDRPMLRRVSVPLVVFGGLADGVNPCAISTLIFFLSLLAANKASRKTRLLVGVSFVLASFCMYFALGFGFLVALRQLPAFPQVRRAAVLAFAAALAVLAALSFRDAARFRRRGDSSELALQLPAGVKRSIHGWMSARWQWGGPILGGVVTGFGVTLLESVCTGQGYVPTLAYLLKNEIQSAQTLCLLFLYNVCFVLPLVAVLVLFNCGARIPALIAWSREHLVAAKILLGLFFLLMAVLILL